MLIAEGADSFRAANLEQMYVSLTRGREGCRIYTDDKEASERTDRALAVNGLRHGAAGRAGGGEYQAA